VAAPAIYLGYITGIWRYCRVPETSLPPPQRREKKKLYSVRIVTL